MTAIAPALPAETRLPSLPERQPFTPQHRLWEHTGLITQLLCQSTGFVLQCMEESFSLVAERHSASTIRTDPTGRAMRANASIMTWIYGGHEGPREADRLRSAHTTLNAVDDDGRRHTALEAGTWAFVLHATFYSILTRIEYFGPALTGADREELFSEYQQLLVNFRVPPKHIHADYISWRAWFDDQVEHHLTATVTARDYLDIIGNLPAPHALPAPLRPLWTVATLPYRRLLRFVTRGTLPAAARDHLGLVWGPDDERRLRRLGRIIGRTVPLLPERIRYLPLAYEARRVEHDRQRLMSTASRPR